MNWLSSALSFLASFFGLARKNQDIINSPEIKKAKERSDQQKAIDKIREEDDIEKARNDFSH